MLIQSKFFLLKISVSIEEMTKGVKQEQQDGDDNEPRRPFEYTRCLAFLTNNDGGNW